MNRLLGRCLPDTGSMPMYDYSFAKVGSYADLKDRYTFKKKLSDY